MTQDEIAPIHPDEGADDIAQRQMRGPALSQSADEAQLAARWRGQARALIFTFCGLLAALEIIGPLYPRVALIALSLESVTPSYDV